MTYAWMPWRIRPQRPMRAYAKGPGRPSDDVLVALLRASARADRAAFARLYDATAPQIFGLMARMTASPADAAALTGLAYLRIWHLCRRFDPATEGALAWMLAIAHRQAMHWLRKSKWTDRPGRRRAGRTARRQLRHALPHWTRTQRSAFIAVYYGCYTQSDIFVLRSATPPPEK